MKGRPSNVITLPQAVKGLASRYVTRSGGQWQPETVALCMALTLRNHGTVEAVRATARRLADRVCLEQQPKLKALARRPTNLGAAKLNGVLDEDVVPVAERIINRVCDLVGIATGVPFGRAEPPRCHMKPMQLHRGKWHCQHCSHTKPMGDKP
ncbi:hypothetical protein D3C78_298040 [compost metagenome]